MNQVTEEQIDAHLTRLASQVPDSAVKDLENILKTEFQKRGVPYSKDTLKACLIMSHFYMPGIPPREIGSQLINATILVVYRLIEKENGSLLVP